MNEKYFPPKPGKVTIYEKLFRPNPAKIRLYESQNVTPQVIKFFTKFFIPKRKSETGQVFEDSPWVDETDFYHEEEQRFIPLSMDHYRLYPAKHASNLVIETKNTSGNLYRPVRYERMGNDICDVHSANGQQRLYKKIFREKAPSENHLSDKIPRKHIFSFFSKTSPSENHLSGKTPKRKFSSFPEKDLRLYVKLKGPQEQASLSQPIEELKPMFGEQFHEKFKAIKNFKCLEKLGNFLDDSMLIQAIKNFKCLEKLGNFLDDPTVKFSFSILHCNSLMLANLNYGDSIQELTFDEISQIILETEGKEEILEELFLIMTKKEQTLCLSVLNS